MTTPLKTGEDFVPLVKSIEIPTVDPNYLKVSGLISKSITQSSFISDYLKTSNLVFDKINKSTLESIQKFLDDSKIDPVLKITSAFRAFQYLDQDTLTNYTVKPATQALYDRFKEAGGLDVWVSLTPDEAFDKINVFDDSISFDQVEISKQELNSLASIKVNDGVFDKRNTPLLHKIHPNSLAVYLAIIVLLLTPAYQKLWDNLWPTEKESKAAISHQIMQLTPAEKAMYIQKKVVFSNKMYVYETPKQLSKKVTHLPIGAIVQIEKEIKDWSLVEFDDSESDIKITGWVLTRYLRKIR